MNILDYSKTSPITKDRNSVKPIQILLVEDNEGDIILTLEAFEEWNTTNHVTVAKDGQAAIDFFGDSNKYATLPDLVLLDINLPKKNGHEVLKFIKSAETLKHIPVIMLTTSSSATDIKLAYNNYANCYITKPDEVDTFLNVVSAIENFLDNNSEATFKHTHLMIKNNPAANILVVEDNEGDFILVESYLDHEVMPVIVHAKSFGAVSAILLTGDVPFDVILLDLTLPDNSGEKLITDIISLSAGCPVIVLTGYTDIEFSIKSLSLGVADYLIKDEINASSLYKSIVYTIERKRSIKELEESEKRYSDLFQLSTQPMWVYDSITLEFLDVNAAAIKHYGYSREDFLSMDIKELIPGEDTTEGSSCFPQDHEPSIVQVICRHRKKNGEIIQVELQSNIIDFKGREAYIALSIDITERLNYISAIEKQNKKLQEIAWIQSHVVRAPLAKIMGLIDLIQNHTLSGTEKDDYLIHILDAANEFDAIVKDIVKKTDLVQLNNA